MTWFLLKSTWVLARAVHLVEVIVDKVIISLWEYVGSLVYKSIIFNRHKADVFLNLIFHLKVTTVVLKSLCKRILSSNKIIFISLIEVIQGLLLFFIVFILWELERRVYVILVLYANLINISYVVFQILAYILFFRNVAIKILAHRL